MLTDAEYFAWKRQKEEEHKRRTHNAEAIDDKKMYALQGAIDRACFNGRLQFLQFYFTPPDLQDKGAYGMYNGNIVMIDRDFYEEHGTDDTMKNLLFHEMAHAFCDNPNPKEKINDTDGEFHLPAFAKVCTEHGGTCVYVDAETGYSDSSLTAESLGKIKNDKYWKTYEGA